MKKNSFLTLIMIFYAWILNAQTDSTYKINAWGSEPFWTFEFIDTIARYNSNSGEDSTITYSLSEHIYNVGFTNEKVDTYIFNSTKNESLMLILTRANNCACGFDMSGESNISAYLYLIEKKRRVMLLGCAKIIIKKL